MALRFWLITFVAAVLVFAAWIFGHPRRAVSLKSEHSRPATVMPAQEVAVTSKGKLFHKPSCRYIHGKPQMMSAQEAAQEGYTPDPRCMKESLPQPN